MARPKCTFAFMMLAAVTSGAQRRAVCREDAAQGHRPTVRRLPPHRPVRPVPDMRCIAGCPSTDTAGQGADKGQVVLVPYPAIGLALLGGAQTFVELAAAGGHQRSPVRFPHRGQRR